MDLDERTSLTLSSTEYIEHMGNRARRTRIRARLIEILSFVEYFVEQVSCVERVFFSLSSSSADGRVFDTCSRSYQSIGCLSRDPFTHACVRSSCLFTSAYTRAADDVFSAPHPAESI